MKAEGFVQAVEREERSQEVAAAVEARARLAIDVAFAKLDGKRAEAIAAMATLAKELHNVAQLHRTGLRRATLEALSKCCSLEYDLSLDTEVTSAFAQDLGLEDALGEYEESLLPTELPE